MCIPLVFKVGMFCELLAIGFYIKNQKYLGIQLFVNVKQKLIAKG
jgi:hypothetical protein